MVCFHIGVDFFGGGSTDLPDVFEFEVEAVISNVFEFEVVAEIADVFEFEVVAEIDG